MGRSAIDSPVEVSSRETKMSAINPIEICPRCHGGGLEPALDRTMLEKIRELFRPVPCYVCTGAGAVQHSLGEERMGELVHRLRRVMERAER